MDSAPIGDSQGLIAEPRDRRMGRLAVLGPALFLLVSDASLTWAKWWPYAHKLQAGGVGCGVLGALLITLPAISLPSMAMASRAFKWRATAAMAVAVAVTGLVAGGLLAGLSG